jgi:hypothetical protein
MTRTNAKAILIGLTLAGGLSACSSLNGGDTAAATGTGENASATVAQSAMTPAAGYSLSNPTNGGPAFVSGTGR